MDPVVVEMHTRSGLIGLIRESTVSLDEAGAATLEFIKTHVPEPRSVPLCGNSIGTDRRFLARYLPAIEDHLHYRCVDVSTVKELAKRWYPSLDNERPFKVGAHRALDDIRDSVRELQFYRERVFIPARPVVPPPSPPAADPSTDRRRLRLSYSRLKPVRLLTGTRRAMLTECVPSPSRRTEDPMC